jgi:hypothetical protein
MIDSVIFYSRLPCPGFELVRMSSIPIPISMALSIY